MSDSDIKLLKTAYQIASEAHVKQKDKAGKPYIYHPLYVASKVKGTNEKVVALLHDVIEDSNITYEDLISKGIPTELAAEVLLLTKDKGTDYFEYLSKVKNNEVAKHVKLADLEHNSNLNRLKHITSKDYARKQKYDKAIKYLREEQ